MRKYFDTALLGNGLPAGGAKVLVLIQSSQFPATIYSDNGVTPTANPVTCDSTGFFSFFAADGTYQLNFSDANGVLLKTVTQVEIVDLQPLGIPSGGTGATTLAGIRTSIGAAASGANSDITSLTGLTTPLTVAQGGTGANNAATARTNLGAAPTASPTFTGTVSGVTAAMVGLGNVNNTSDLAKPISTATQSALNQKANLVGVTDGSNAPAGQLGEYLTNSTLTTSVTNAVAANATSIPLGAGDWDVQGSVRFNPAGTTVVSLLQASISTSSATSGGLGAAVISQGTLGTGTQQILATPVTRISISASTTVYVVCNQGFTTSTMTADGFIRARRVR